MNLFDALKETGEAYNEQFTGHTIYFIEDKKVKFFSKNGEVIESQLSMSDALDDSWIPYKKPCVHEPAEYDLNLILEAKTFDPSLNDYRGNKSKYGTSVLANSCKHCGVRIKAESWIELHP